MGKPKPKRGASTTAAGITAWAGIVIALLSTLQMVWKEKPWFLAEATSPPAPSSTVRHPDPLPIPDPDPATVQHVPAFGPDGGHGGGGQGAGRTSQPLPPPPPVPAPEPPPSAISNPPYPAGVSSSEAYEVYEEAPTVPVAIATLVLGLCMLAGARMWIWRRNQRERAEAQAAQVATTVVVPKL